MTPTSKSVFDHVIDVFKGAIGAAVAAAILTFFHYLGVDLVPVLKLAALATGGVLGVKIT